MTKKNWTHLFPDSILEKGEDYADNGAVKDLKIQNDRITAVVSGNYDYRVTIELTDGFPTSLHCSCPYAEKGNYCKHMAAVLFKAVERETEWDSGTKAELEKIIQEMPREKLNALMLEIVRNDISLANELRVQFSDEISTSAFNQLIKELDVIFDEYDEDDYIDDEELEGMVDDIDHFLKAGIGGLMKQGHYMEAFTLSLHLFFRARDVEINTGMEMDYFYDACRDIWSKIIRKCPGEEKEVVKRKLLQAIQDHSDDDFACELIDEFLDDELYTDDDRRGQLKEIDEAIEAFEKDHGKTAVTETFLRQPDVRARICLMEELGAGEEEVEAWCREHWQFADVRDICMNKAENRGDKKKVISILEESRKLDEANPLLVKEYSDRLLKLYEEAGDRKKVADELLDRFHHESHEEQRNIYHRIRKLLSKEEWPVYRDKMLPSFEYRSEQLGLLSEERDKTALYEMIFKNPAHSGMPDLYEIGAYARMLKKDYAREIFQAYIDHAEADVLTAKKRADYEVLICQLEHISQFKGGKEEAVKLAEKWLVTYPRKRLLEEKLLEFLGKHKGK